MEEHRKIYMNQINTMLQTLDNEQLYIVMCFVRGMVGVTHE